MNAVLASVENTAPELLSPDEYVGTPASFRMRIAHFEGRLAALHAAAAHGDPIAAQDLVEADGCGATYRHILESLRAGEIEGQVREMTNDHRLLVRDSLLRGRSVSAVAVERYEEDVPTGYARLGDILVGPCSLEGAAGI